MAFVPFVSLVAWVPFVVAIALGIVALVKRQKPTVLSIASLAVSALGWIVAVIVSFSSLASLATNIDQAAPPVSQAPAAAPAEPTNTAASEAEPVETPNPEAAPVEVPAAEPAAAEPVAEPVPVTPAEATLGQTVVNDDGVEVTFQAVTCGMAVAGDSFMEETANGQFCQVSFTVLNGSTDALNLSDSDFNGEISGIEYEPTFSLTRFGDDYYSTEVNPGLSISGTIYIDIPAGAILDHVVYEQAWAWFTDPVRVAVA